MCGTFRVVFWNLHGNERALELGLALCESRNVDLFIATELPRGSSRLRRSPTARLGYASLREGLQVRELGAYAHAIALRVCVTPTSLPLSIVGVHLPSRLYLRSDEDQRMAAENCRGFVEDLERASQRGGEGHDRTVVIGDFNLDPYSSAMVGFAGLNAMMTRSSRRERKLRRVRRAVFYNPMWNEFGDLNWPPGTYHLHTPGALGYRWHMLDQVLLRPSLVPHFQAASVLIEDDLVSSRARTPNRDISDHLPIELLLSEEAFAPEEGT